MKSNEVSLDSLNGLSSRIIMKKAVFIGNCQCSGLRAVLQYTHFDRKYESVQYANWQMIKNQEAPPYHDLETADVIIYQPLSDVHGCFSTDPSNPNSMLQTCRPDALVLSFPRMHNNSLWPVYKKHQLQSIYYGGPDIYSYYERQGIRTKSQFFQLYDTGALNFQMDERWRRNMAITLKKEENTTVKVHDYIQQNIRSQRLFLTHDHPTTALFQHCVSQLLEPLGIDFLDSVQWSELDKNITGLQDSVYQHSSCMYPDSSYMWSYTEPSTINDAFYRTELSNYLDSIPGMQHGTETDDYGKIYK